MPGCGYDIQPHRKFSITNYPTDPTEQSPWQYCELVMISRVFYETGNFIYVFVRHQPSPWVHKFCENLLMLFYIRGSMHRNSRLKKSNEMQQYEDSYLLLNYSTCFGHPSHPSSAVHKTVVAASGTDHTIWGTSFLKCDRIRSSLFGNVWGSFLPRYYDLYQRLQLQFYVLLMMGAMDARNM